MQNNNQIQMNDMVIHDTNHVLTLYAEYNGDTMANEIIKHFIYADALPKIQTDKGKIKYITTRLTFNDFDLMKEYNIFQLSRDIGIGNFVATLKPKSQAEFNLYINICNHYLRLEIARTRARLYRNFELSLYELPIIVRNGTPVSKIVLVPCNSNAINNFQNHPAFSKENAIQLDDRSLKIRNRIGHLGDRLKHREGNMEEVHQALTKLIHKNKWVI